MNNTQHSGHGFYIIPCKFHPNVAKVVEHIRQFVGDQQQFLAIKGKNSPILCVRAYIFVMYQTGLTII